MNIAIMQPYFLPYLGYWQLLSAVDTFVIFDDVNYINRSYITRNSILIEGNSKRITLNSIGASQNKLINQVKAGNNGNKLLKSIEHAYKKSPMFNDVFPLVENILQCPEDNLAKFLGNSIVSIAGYLGINAKIIYSSTLPINNELKSQARVIDICLKLEATTYINAIGGQELYNKSDFLKQNIKLKFLEPELSPYSQFKNEFIPALSIIDIMMFNSKEDIKDMLTNYNLV